mgnify:FL=1
MVLLLGAGTPSSAADLVERCKGEVQGMKIWMSSTVATSRQDLLPRLEEVAFPRWCECYHGRLRVALGRDLYERTRDFRVQLTPSELLQQDTEDRKAVIGCVEEQLGNRPGSQATLAPPDSKFARFMRATLAPKGEVGGLRLGASRTAMFEVLGETKTFQPRHDGGEEYFYGPNSIEVKISISPPPARSIRMIELDRHFQGQTPSGGRIGDSPATIRKTYPGSVAVELPGYLVYCDGTTFLFSGGRLESIRISTLEVDVFKAEITAHCAR